MTFDSHIPMLYGMMEACVLVERFENWVKKKKKKKG